MNKLNTVIYGLMLVGTYLWSFSANADQCQMGNLKVVDVFQWDDGSIFLDFDKPIGCGCAFDSRAGFHKDDNQKFLMSLAITAVATGKSVMIRADNVNLTCPIHGNTARLTTLVLNNN